MLSPLLLGIALAVKLGSRGPVLYRSMRPGIGGAPFACLKFRTMVVGADSRQYDLEQRNEASGALFKMRRDPRLTRVGRALRRFSLDELPQLANVLRGQMSLVGPRPLPQRDFERLDEWHMQRYQVMPGMTGLWQVSGRANLDFDDLVRLDFLYLERWSVFLDLAILRQDDPRRAARGRRLLELRARRAAAAACAASPPSARARRQPRRRPPTSRGRRRSSSTPAAGGRALGGDGGRQEAPPCRRSGRTSRASPSTS